jgi:hypothetical protein
MFEVDTQKSFQNILEIINLIEIKIKVFISTNIEFISIEELSICRELLDILRLIQNNIKNAVH